MYWMTQFEVKKSDSATKYWNISRLPDLQRYGSKTTGCLNTSQHRQEHDIDGGRTYTPTHLNTDTHQPLNRKRQKRIYALQVSAHSGPGRPSDFAGRRWVCVWAASCRRSLPPGGRCSQPAACRPPPPAGRDGLPTPYLRGRQSRQGGEGAALSIIDQEGSHSFHSLILRCTRCKVNAWKVLNHHKHLQWTCQWSRWSATRPLWGATRRGNAQQRWILPNALARCASHLWSCAAVTRPAPLQGGRRCADVAPSRQRLHSPAPAELGLIPTSEG